MGVKEIKDKTKRPSSENQDMQTLAEKLRRCRKAKGLSQQKLAEELGIQYQSVQDWERGKTRPSLDKVVRLCEIFGVTSTWLLHPGGKEYPAREESLLQEPPALYGMDSEGRKYLEMFQRLRPDTKEIVVKIMEALFLKDKAGKKI